MTSVVPNPAELAQRLDGARLEPSDGPVGDARLDEAVARLSDAVETFVTTSTPSMSAAGQDEDHEAPGGASSESLAPDADAVGAAAPDAANVIAQAQQAHDALQDRLGQAQA